MRYNSVRMNKGPALLLTIACLVAAPVLAQTQIGGGACSASSLNGVYALTMTGRLVSSGGTFSAVFQANGSATFDGKSSVSFALTANTNGAAATQLTYSGSYTVQANCTGTVTISSGDTATFNVVVYTQGSAFSMTGHDATYTFSGGGSMQAANCLVSTLSGSYATNGTGYTLFGSSVSGITDGTGLVHFDGQGNVTVSLTLYSGAAPASYSATGTYTISPACVGSATLTDSTGKPAAMALSIIDANGANLDASLANSSFMITGAGHTAGTTTCSAASLNGTYAFSLTGRDVTSAGTFSKVFQGSGSATFDGVSKMTVTMTLNTNQSAGMPLTSSGTYTIQSNCSGTATITTAGTGSFSLAVYAQGKNLLMTGQDSTFVYSGNGATPPGACVMSTVSGAYAFLENGFALSGASITGVADVDGLLQFDGQGNVSMNWNTSSGGTFTSNAASGTYSVSPGCLGSATLVDAAKVSYNLNFSVNTATGADFDVISASSQALYSGTGHSTFVNPSQAIGNVASYAIGATPPGSIFVLFGENLAAQASSPGLPLPTSVQGTSVTVNQEAVPLFYVSPTQIDAQMPEDIQPGLATLVVKNGNSVSAATVVVPSTGTPGISVYGTNRAVVVNQDGSVNSSTAPAKVGDTVVAFFTGGGPVQAVGTLTTGAPSPSGLSPVTGTSSITIGGVAAASIPYIGLTPGSIGLYQANFVIPQVAKGDHPLVITIAGQKSNNPLMTTD